MLINTHTYFSFNYGTMSPQKLVEDITGKGYSHFAITDINNTSACFELLRELPHNPGLRLAFGIDFRNGMQQQYVGLAQNNQGFMELNLHLTHYLHAGKEFLPRAPYFEHVCIVYPFSKHYFQLKPKEYIGISAADLNQLPFSPWKDHPHKLVLLQPVSFRNKYDYNAHRLLRSIEKNCLLSMLPKNEQALPSEVLMPYHELQQLFKGSSNAVVLKNTQELL
ncbi:MAG: PHP domain-containing protein, partial [Bacteroidales bacterium]|nr:PHP domain-containing protein [Bacteroidales bacterium]